MSGMNNITGQPLTGTDHIMQSIRDILTTRKGTRLMEPEYGSDIPRLIGAGITKDAFVDIYAAVASALRRWEKRIKVRRVQVVDLSPGNLVVDIDLQLLANGNPITLSGVQL